MFRAVYKNHYPQKFYSQRSEIEKVLLLSTLFGIGLSLFRIFYTGKFMFLGLSWNLLLAFIPYAISNTLVRRIDWIENKWKFSMMVFGWLIFIPNSFYIITDLFHLEQHDYIPLWFDLVLIFSFAWNGLLLGILSMRQMEKIWQAKWKGDELLFIYPVMLLNALGIYIGRYLRYNSWDIISDPFDLSGDIIYLLIHPIRNRFDWSMIFCFSVFMTLLYLSFKKINKEANS
jgi:uncharacterized membrane protein